MLKATNGNRRSLRVFLRYYPQPSSSSALSRNERSDLCRRTDNIIITGSRAGPVRVFGRAQLRTREGNVCARARVIQYISLTFKALNSRAYSRRERGNKQPKRNLFRDPRGNICVFILPKGSDRREHGASDVLFIFCFFLLPPPPPTPAVITVRRAILLRNE